MQIALLLLLLLMGYLFINQGNKLNSRTGKKLCNKYFDRMFILAEIAVFLDGVTVYTVNHRDSVPEPVNLVAHALYLVFLQLFICEHFLYWLDITGSIPSLKKKLLWLAPEAVFVAATLITMPLIYYVDGERTDYSMGVPDATHYQFPKCRYRVNP